VRGLGLGLRSRVRAAVKRPDISFGHTFMRPPWGGSNQFLLALRDEFERRGLRVENAIAPRTRAALLNAYVFDEVALRRQLHEGCRVVHRIDGPLALYRGFDDGTDDYIARVNAELAHATVVQSDYSLRANAERGHEFRAPVVVHNAVDQRIFFPVGDRGSFASRKVRLISTSWSDNPNKGAATYAWLDAHLDWARYEWTFVGNSPVGFENIRVVPPTDSEGVAAALRASDVFVLASLNEPCSNALLEALACGLPAVYAGSGGNSELAGDAGIPFDRAEDVPASLDRLVEEYDDHRAAISIATIEQVADRYLEVLLP
jgi:glycosyltransferase involved in cell wall biosynthesis